MVLTGAIYIPKKKFIKSFIIFAVITLGLPLVIAPHREQALRVVKTLARTKFHFSPSVSFFFFLGFKQLKVL